MAEFRTSSCQILKHLDVLIFDNSRHKKATVRTIRNKKVKKNRLRLLKIFVFLKKMRGKRGLISYT